MIKKLIIFIYLLAVSILYADFDLAPQIQRMSLDRPGTQKIYLKNETNKLKKIKIYSRRPENQRTKDLYMGDWIVVYPKIVYLKPNSKKTIRMAARPPKGLVDGEYRSHLVFEELPVNKYDNTKKDEGKTSARIEIMYELVSTVYGYKGKLEYGGTFEGFKVIEDRKKNYLTSKIINTGTTALDVIYKVTYYKGMNVLKNEDLLLGKVMRENHLDPIVELNEITKDATKMKVEFYYRIKNEKMKEKQGEKEYDEFKLGEKFISLEKISMEEYTKELEEKKKKEVEIKKLEKEKVESEGKKES